MPNPRSSRGFNVDARVELIPENKLHLYRHCDTAGCGRHPVFVCTYAIPPEGKTRAMVHHCRPHASDFAKRNGTEVPA